MNSSNYFANRKQFSFFLLHIAILLMAIGITGSKGITEGKEQVFRFNDTMRLKNYSITYRKLDWRYEKGKTVAIATVDVLGKQGRETYQAGAYLLPETGYEPFPGGYQSGSMGRSIYHLRRS